MTRRTFALTLAAGKLYAEAPNQKGRAIIDKAIQALGGDAFRNLRTRTETGRAYSFYRQQMTGLSLARIQTKYLPADGVPSSDAAAGKIRQLQRQAFGKKQEEVVLITAGQAYEITYKGATPLADVRSEQLRETTLQDIFYILRQRLNESGLVINALGTDVIENQRVETVQIFDDSNRALTVWFNANTFLPVKQRFFRFDPVIKDRREEVTRYSLYRDAGSGVMWPFSTERERDTEKVFQLFADSVAVNEAMPDSIFELPPGIKMLKKPV